LIAYWLESGNSRIAGSIQRVIACLVEWLTGAENANPRRAFVVRLRRVLLPARVPRVKIPDFNRIRDLANGSYSSFDDRAG